MSMSANDALSQTTNSPEGSASDQSDHSAIEHEQQQAKLYAAYVEQQRRMQCPGCGEDSQIY
ncbi:hypothetical protein [Botrimarina mediterranea]|uniref:Uncharacterized protein n=1 Tax=Botrimarina mediterranea TaxID=2528022 RepID=A0A518K5Z4_9BACT|nr:hypothetical protein [Botrimarina mediterranea]QDV73210.1 hypothetical protein Spa11_14060 [Botrimarina mediterranea]